MFFIGIFLVNYLIVEPLKKILSNGQQTYKNRLKKNE